MRKRTWMDLSIAVLGLFLVCSAAQGVAQTQEPYGTGGAGDATAQGTGQVTDIEAQQRLEIARLRVEVARLQQELAQARARLAQAGSAEQQGTGGAGTEGIGNTGTEGTGGAGIGDPNAEAPEDATGLGDPAAEGVGGGGRAGGPQVAQPDTDNQGQAVANVIYTGRVRSVSPQRLVLEFEGGSSNTLTLAREVRVFRGRQQVSLRSLREGTLVRASADLYARGNPVTQIEVIPPAARQAP